MDNAFLLDYCNRFVFCGDVFYLTDDGFFAFSLVLSDIHGR